VDGFDDPGVVGALQVDSGDAETGVAELALDHDQRFAFASQLDGVCVLELADPRLAEEDQIRPVVLPVRVIDPRVRSRERTGGPWVGHKLDHRSEFPRTDLVDRGARSDTPSAQAAQA
jgi:hypothetical protein